MREIREGTAEKFLTETRNPELSHSHEYKIQSIVFEFIDAAPFSLICIKKNIKIKMP